MTHTVTERVIPLPGRADDPDFHLSTYQCGEGPAVVFVHGFPDLARGWRHQLPVVADAGFRAIAPDMRGYGSSSYPEAVEAYTLAELTGVEPRLLTRLEGGLVVELPPPEREIRQEVASRLLRAKLDLEDAELSAYLGSRPVESVRGLHGLVQRVLTAAEVQELAPSAALAREVLEGPPSKRPSDRRRVRSSGIVAPTAGGPRSREKMIWTWPDAGGRVIEEWR